MSKIQVVKIWVLKKNGTWLPGYGHRAFGECFEVSRDIGKVLIQASPDVFSKKKPAKDEEV